MKGRKRLGRERKETNSTHNFLQKQCIKEATQEGRRVVAPVDFGEADFVDNVVHLSADQRGGHHDRQRRQDVAPPHPVAILKLATIPDV
eukprot:2939539-Rhodomonas_salina.3